MKKQFVKALTIISLMSISQISQANDLITNGSFESGLFQVNHPGDVTETLGVGSTAMTGWTVESGSLAWIGPSNPFSLTASQGSYFLDLTDYRSSAPWGGVSQTISTTVGQTYLLSFDLGSSPTYGVPDSIQATAGSASSIFTSTFTSGTNNWQTEYLNFTATAATTTISLTGNTGSNYIGLDNVSVNAVPEPEEWAMMLLGLPLIGWIVRRKQQVNPMAAFA